MSDQLSNLPDPKRALLDEVVTRLSRVDGVAAVVLGGSYASGTAHAASDLDIGIYYAEAAPFSLDAIRQIATELAEHGQATVTGFYEWGAWVNGGAWIHTAQGKVDFLYRSLEHVQRTINEAQQGITHHDYDQQPTYGFYSVIYLAETQICLPLYDPAGHIAMFKRQVATYPPLLKQKLVTDALWAVEFTLIHARNFAAQGDIYNTVGCLTRGAADLTQALFALNERYFMRDKQLLATIANFPLLPPAYTQQLNQLLAHPGDDAAALTASVNALTALWRSVVALPGVAYTPRFQI